MKHKILIFAFCFLICSFRLLAEDTWVQTYQPFYNPAGDNDYYVEDVLVCDDGGYAVNGYYWYFEDWIEDQWGYLMKTDSDGNFLWAKKDTVSWIDETESSAFVQTDDGGFLSAVYSLWGGTALIKRNNEGNREWVSNCGDLYIHSMDKTNDGNIILGGRMNGLPAIRKINQNAEIDWEYTYYLSGSGNGSVQSITKTSDGGYAATGYTSGNGFDIFVLKVDSSGDSLWTQTFDGYGLFDQGNRILETFDSNILVCGFYDYSAPIYKFGFLSKLDFDGDIMFSHQFEGWNIRSCVQAQDSNYIIFSGRALLKTNDLGDTLWYNVLPYSSLNCEPGNEKSIQSIDTGYICVSIDRISGQDYIVLYKTNESGIVTVSDNIIFFENNWNLRNYPNPFNPSTTISFNIYEPAKVELDIFNIKGQKIKTVVDTRLEKGIHEVVWNGRNEHNKSIASGVYFYKLRVSGRDYSIKKCLMLK